MAPWQNPFLSKDSLLFSHSFNTFIEGRARIPVSTHQLSSVEEAATRVAPPLSLAEKKTGAQDRA